MSSSRRRPERRLSIAQGRDAREIQLPRSAGKCFLLTSPFIERVRQIILRRPRGERDAGMLRYAQHDRPPQSPGVPMYMVRDPLLMREKEGQLRHAKPQKGQARPGEFSLFVLRTFAALRLCVRLLCPQNILSQLLWGKGGPRSSDSGGW